MINAGIEVHTLTDGHVYTADKTELVDLVSSLVILSRAHEESRTKSLRVASAWSNKRKSAASKKLTARCPAWLVLSDDRKEFRVIEERAELVRRIFIDTVEGIGAYTLTRQLNEAGVPGFGSGAWHESSLNKILGNRAVLGEFQPHRSIEGKRVPDGEPIRDYFPRIIDDELFYRAQVAREQRRTMGAVRKGEGVANLFSGLLKCAYCRSRMLFERKNYNYLTCYSAKRGLGCTGKRWRYEEFETSFLHFVREVDLASLIHGDDDAKKRAVLEGIVTSLRGEVASIKSQMDRMLELLQVAGTATSYVAEKLQELERRRASVEAEMGEKEKELTRGRVEMEVGDVKELIEQVQASPGEETYRLRTMIASRLRSVVAEIRIAPAGHVPRFERILEFLRGQEDAERFVEHFRKLLGEERTKRRYFSILFSSGDVRVVYPDPHDPARFAEQIVSSDEEGLVRHLPGATMQVFPPRTKGLIRPRISRR
jgi:hypothetical protein